MKNPRKTGISAITGSITTVRHADAVERRDIMKRIGTLPRGLREDELVVATRDGRIEAFALPVPCSNSDVCITVAERKGAAAMGRLALQHLVEKGTIRAVREERRNDRRPAARGQEEACGLPAHAMRAVRI